MDRITRRWISLGVLCLAAIVYSLAVIAIKYGFESDLYVYEILNPTAIALLGLYFAVERGMLPASDAMRIKRRAYGALAVVSFVLSFLFALAGVFFAD